MAATGSDAGKSALVAGLCRWLARELAEAAHQRCPYSRATRGNISVGLRVR